MSETTTKPIVKFRAIEREDLATLRDWRNQLMVNFRQWRHLNMQNQEEWLVSVTSGDRHIMMAVDNEGGILVGVVGLTYINWVVRHAEASIYIAPGQAGRGYGKAALQELVDYGFGEACMHRIWAEIFEFNKASLGLFESCGFKREGVFREGHFTGGKWVSSVVLSVLENEWRKQ